MWHCGFSRCSSCSDLKLSVEKLSQWTFHRKRASPLFGSAIRGNPSFSKGAHLSWNSSVEFVRNANFPSSNVFLSGNSQFQFETFRLKMDGLRGASLPFYKRICATDCTLVYSCTMCTPTHHSVKENDSLHFYRTFFIANLPGFRLIKFLLIIRFVLITRRHYLASSNGGWNRSSNVKHYVRLRGEPVTLSSMDTV